MVEVVSRRFHGNRREMRQSLVDTFLAEEPGTGKGALCSRYIYKVDKSHSGHVIELHRPAFLNKGIDFTVRCQTVCFNPGKTRWKHVPKHDDLIEILRGIKTSRPRLYRGVKESLQRVYECKRVQNYSDLEKFMSPPLVNGAMGCPGDVAVLVAKWLFAEQDITYWNYSGRAMLYSKLRAEELV